MQLENVMLIHRLKLSVCLKVPIIAPHKVEAPITDHLRDSMPYLKKFKAVHIFPM